MEDCKRNITKSIRLSEEELQLIEKCAKESDRKVADFIRVATLRYIEFSKQTNK